MLNSIAVQDGMRIDLAPASVRACSGVDVTPEMTLTCSSKLEIIRQPENESCFLRGFSRSSAAPRLTDGSLKHVGDLLEASASSKAFRAILGTLVMVLLR